MHLKRKAAPINWIIARKGTKYIVRPKSNIKNGLPIILVLRDILKIARNMKEVKKAISSEKILLNFRKIKDEKQSMLLFDVLKIIPDNKYYKLVIGDNGKFKVKEIEETDAKFKVSKIINKKVLKGKRIQLNLLDGRNFIYDKKCNVNDSLLINLKENKAEKVIPLKENSKVFIFDGKHAGKTGIVKSINKKNKTVDVNFNGNLIRVLIKHVIVSE